LFFQLFYFKYVSGHWWYNAYGSEGFFFNHPHAWAGLFSFRKGFFIYSPCMLLILPGFYLALSQKKVFAVSVLVFSLLYTYVIFSWWCWWYGGGLGCRPMIDIYAVLAFPLSVSLKLLCNSIKPLQVVTAGFIFFCIILNVFQTWQFSFSLLPCDGTTWKYYKKIWASKLFYQDSQLDIDYADNISAVKGLPCKDVISIDVTNFMHLVNVDTINILSAENKFVCALSNQNNMVKANSSNPWNWETFIMRKYKGDLYTFEASNHLFWGLADTLNGMITADFTQNQTQSVFRLIKEPSGCFVFKTSNSNYVTVVDKDDNLLSAGTENINEASCFTIKNKNR
jgi:hypothetical protein